MQTATGHAGESELLAQFFHADNHAQIFGHNGSSPKALVDKALLSGPLIHAVGSGRSPAGISQ